MLFPGGSGSCRYFHPIASTDEGMALVRAANLPWGSGSPPQLGTKSVHWVWVPSVPAQLW